MTGLLLAVLVSGTATADTIDAHLAAPLRPLIRAQLITGYRLARLSAADTAAGPNHRDRHPSPTAAAITATPPRRAGNRSRVRRPPGCAPRRPGGAARPAHPGLAVPRPGHPARLGRPCRRGLAGHRRPAGAWHRRRNRPHPPASRPRRPHRGPPPTRSGQPATARPPPVAGRLRPRHPLTTAPHPAPANAAPRMGSKRTANRVGGCRSANPATDGHIQPGITRPNPRRSPGHGPAARIPSTAWRGAPGPVGRRSAWRPPPPGYGHRQVRECDATETLGSTRLPHARSGPPVRGAATPAT